MARILVAMGFAGLVGCQLVFPREVPVPDAPVDAPPDGPIPVGCSPMSMLADSFTGPLSEVLWVPTTVVATDTDRLSFHFDTEADKFLSSRYSYDLREQAITFDVTTMNYSPGDVFSVNLYARNGDRVTLQYEAASGNLTANRHENGSDLAVGNPLPYDPTSHKFWQISRTGDRIKWSVGPSADNLATKIGDALMPQVDYAQVELHAAHHSSSGSTDTFIDAINGGTPSGSACPVGMLQDQFPGPDLDLKWFQQTASMCTNVANGGLVMTPMDINYGCGVASRTVVDATSRTVAIELSPPPTDATFFFLLSLGGPNSIGFRVIWPTVDAVKFDPSFAAFGMATPTITTSLWLEVENAVDGTLFWKWSADGVNFNEIANLPDAGAMLDKTDLEFSLHGADVVAPLTIRQVR